MASSRDDPIVLACGADEAYAEHMAAMLTSVLENYSGLGEFIIYVFDNGLRARTRKVIQDVSGGRVRWIEPDTKQLSDLKVTGHISASTYLRLLIPHELPVSVDRVL